nr:nucleoside triphosphate pyrophosphohydrolase [Oscillatoria laete-virens]
MEIMNRLRAPDGCPWDREQTHRSIKKDLIEECYELAEAIDVGDDEMLREELGDLLLQVVFHAQIAREEGRFGFDDVAAEIADKLIRRHPHVFGDARVGDSAGVLRQWDQIKAQEYSGKEGLAKRESALDGIPRELPTLLKAEKLLKKAGKVGFTWKTADEALAKFEEEARELEEVVNSTDPEALQDELGDVLFTLVNLIRLKGYSADDLLARTLKKFDIRFRLLENHLREQRKDWDDYSLDELNKLFKKLRTTHSAKTD